MKNCLLSVENLSIEYLVGDRHVPAVRNVSFCLEKKNSLAIVGESGCGKTTLGLSILKLLPNEARITHGSISLDGTDILKLKGEELRKIRGGRIGCVFQDPLSSLNPVIKIGEQMRETLDVHGLDTSDEKIKTSLQMVQLGDTARVMESYPHQLSGGMRQRVMIAQALCAGPEILIADEPTTALDATIQKEILELLKKLTDELGLTLIFITHNFGIISGICKKIAVLYAGAIVEEGDTYEVFRHPRHPYTKALLSIIPKTGTKAHSFNTIPGSPPDPAILPAGCKFNPRCTRAIEKCRIQEPELVEQGSCLLRCFNPEP
jgi:oligopeptide/dipeptide ABC transporter ATP-binding protein